MSSPAPDLLLHRIALKIRQSLKLDEILNTAATQVRQLLNTDRVLLYRMDSAEEGTVVVESVDPAWPTILGEVIHDPCFASGWDEKYRRGRISTIPDIHADQIRPCYAEMLTRFAVRANLVVPILERHTSVEDLGLSPSSELATAPEDTLWGLLIAHQCSGPRHWTDIEQNTLQQLATHLAIAIQQAEQHQQLQAELLERQDTEAALRQSQKDYQTLVETLEDRVATRSRDLEQQIKKANLFAEIALRIRQSLRLDDILQATVQQIQNCLHADRVLVYQVFANGTGKTISEAVANGYPKILGMTFPEEVFPEEYRERYRQGRVAAIPDVHTADAPLTDCLVEFVEQWAVQAKLIAPILQLRRRGDAVTASVIGDAADNTTGSETALWGLLIIHQCSAPRQWTTFDIDLCRSLADQVGVAIAQANFTQSLEEQVQERTTQLTSSLQATAASEAKFRQLAENIRDVFFLCSPDAQQFFYISPAYESLFGHPCEHLYDDPSCWFSTVHPDDQEHIQQVWLQPEHAHQGLTLEYRILRSDGQQRWMLVRTFPIQADTGDVQRIAGIAEDISERKQAEEAFKRSTVARSLVGDILRDLKSQAHLSPTAMFQAGQALAERLNADSLPEFLETFSLMGLGSLELIGCESILSTSAQSISQSQRWCFNGYQLVEVKPGSDSPTCHYARGFLCGAVAKTEHIANAEARTHELTTQQVAAIEISCSSMGDEQCQFIVQLVAR